MIVAAVDKAKRRALCRTVLAAALLVCNSAWAEAPLRVMIPDVPPWAYGRADGRPGLLVDLLRGVAAQGKFQFEVMPIVYVRMAASLAVNGSDLAVGLISPALQEAGREIVPFFDAKTVLVGRASAPPDLKQLNGKHVGIVRGAYYTGAQANDPGIIRHEVKDIPSGVQMVAAGRIDFLMGSVYAVDYAITHAKWPAHTFSAPVVIAPLNFAVYARRDLPEESIARIRKAVQDFQRSPEWERIIARYPLSLSPK